MIGGRGRPEVVFLGDSITFAWPIPPAERGRRLNRGVPGETSRDMLARLDADVLRPHPYVLHLMAGTNDVAGNGGPYDERATLDAVATIVRRTRDAGIAVVIGAVPPAAALWWNPDVDAVPAIRSLDRGLAALAERTGAGFANYGRVLDDGTGAMRAGFADDGVHPNAAGYAAMEPIARAAIDAALGWRGHLARWSRRRLSR